MPTRNVVLTDHLAQVVDGLVAKGRYQNASEAICEGVRLLEREEAEMAAFLERINAAYDEAERADFAEGSTDEVFARVLARAEGRWAKRREDEARAS